jgi:hypothetical protein
LFSTGSGILGTSFDIDGSPDEKNGTVTLVQNGFRKSSDLE